MVPPKSSGAVGDADHGRPGLSETLEARKRRPHPLVMPGLDPGIHVLLRRPKVVDGQVKPGHDGEKNARATMA
jgi:hypothetical protein